VANALVMRDETAKRTMDLRQEELPGAGEEDE
jgi:hypothetical protein